MSGGLAAAWDSSVSSHIGNITSEQILPGGQTWDQITQNLFCRGLYLETGDGRKVKSSWSPFITDFLCKAVGQPGQLCAGESKKRGCGKTLRTGDKFAVVCHWPGRSEDWARTKLSSPRWWTTLFVLLGNVWNDVQHMFDRVTKGSLSPMFVVIAVSVGVTKWRVVWERWRSPLTVERRPGCNWQSPPHRPTGGISTHPQYLETESLSVNSSQVVFEEIIILARNGLAGWKYYDLLEWYCVFLPTSVHLADVELTN